MALTRKKQDFCKEYIKDFNGTQAAIRAGYSEKTAQEQSSRLLSTVIVQTEIARLMEDRSKRTQIDSDWALQRLARDVTADLADLYDDQGGLKPIKEWPMVWRTGLVAGIETVQERDGIDDNDKPVFVTVRKVKLADRTKLLELLGRHVDVGAFKDKIEHSADKMTLEALVSAANKNG
jgi:phage terminase small subunit